MIPAIFPKDGVSCFDYVDTKCEDLFEMDVHDFMRAEELDILLAMSNSSDSQRSPPLPPLNSLPGKLTSMATISAALKQGRYLYCLFVETCTFAYFLFFHSQS